METLNFLSSSLFSLFSDILPLISLSVSCYSNTPETRTPKNDDKIMQGSSVSSSSFSVGEMNVVMRRLGMRCKIETEAEEEEERESIAIRGELEGVFEEEEPSLEEIKEAFQVFDENRDGFIDAEELGRVLSGLGLIKGLRSNYDVLIKKCENIIRGFDSNGDGLLDFHDFIKVMELSLNLS